MRKALFAALAAAAVGLTAAGCGPSKPFDGPTVDAFNGKVVHNGKPVSFPADEKVELKLFHEKGESFGIPIQPDGSFQIGWMPIGKYTATLLRDKHEGGKKSAPGMYSVPGGLTITDGQTEYTIELGKGWKP
jgi:hypothetical protein